MTNDDVRDTISHPCPGCGTRVYMRRKYCSPECTRAGRISNNQKMHAHKVAIGERKETDNDNMCMKCVHNDTCHVDVKLGRRLPCQVPGEPDILVIDRNVASEFDGLSLVKSVWRK